MRDHQSISEDHGAAESAVRMDVPDIAEMAQDFTGLVPVSWTVADWDKRDWVVFCNAERPHAALGGRTPAEANRGRTPVDVMDKPLRALPTSPEAQQQQKDSFKEILAA